MRTADPSRMLRAPTAALAPAHTPGWITVYQKKKRGPVPLSRSAPWSIQVRSSETFQPELTPIFGSPCGCIRTARYNGRRLLASMAEASLHERIREDGLSWPVAIIVLAVGLHRGRADDVAGWCRLVAPDRTVRE